MSTGAVQHYSQALELLPHDHGTLSNRSAAMLQLGRPADALEDALKCVKVICQAPDT